MPRCERSGPTASPLTVVVLHGASGLDAYRATAMRVADAGYAVLLPHFYDATHSRNASDDNLKMWTTSVDQCIQSSATSGTRVVLFGISLGASVALAEGVSSTRIDSVIDWSGSLPDYAFGQMQRLPPLLILHGAKDTNVPVINAQQLFTLCERTHTTCAGTIYPNEGHLFLTESTDAWSRTLAFLKQRAAATNEAAH